MIQWSADCARIEYIATTRRFLDGAMRANPRTVTYFIFRRSVGPIVVFCGRGTCSEDSGQLVDLDAAQAGRYEARPPSSQVCHNLGLKHLIPFAQLVPERPPTMTEVVFPAKQFNLATLSLTSQDALNHVVQFVRFAGRLAHFGEQDLGVEAAVEPTPEARRRVG
jgi:hypothetical protein